MTFAVPIVVLSLFAGLAGWRANHRRTHDGAEPPNWKAVVFAFAGAWAVFVVAAFLVAAL